MESLAGTLQSWPRSRRLRAFASAGLWSAGLLGIPTRQAGAQGLANAPSPAWAVWAFGRVGVTQTSQLDSHGRLGATLASVGGGVVASRGLMLGMVRAASTAGGTFSDSPATGLRDVAVLAGLRSRGEHRFLTGAAGIADVKQTGEPSFGSVNSRSQLALTYDASAHASSRLAGIGVAVSGVLGPARVRYLAFSLEADLGRLRLR